MHKTTRKLHKFYVYSYVYVLRTSFFSNRSVLYEETLMKRIIGYVMKKLQVMDKDSTKIIQLIEILTALCTCKGVPVKQNQCELTAIVYTHACTLSTAPKLL